MNRGFAYTQARIQARFANLADEPVWQHLEAARSLSGFIEEARHTPLAHWLSEFSLVSDHHHIEQGLQRRFHDLVYDIRHWAPEPWRRAVDWTLWLPELPALHRMTVRDMNAPFRFETKPPAELVMDSPTPIARRWLERWRELWPSPGRRQTQGLENLVTLVDRHMAAFPGVPAEAAWGSRKQLVTELRMLFRRQALQPAALFTTLALSALELERLRAALVVRAAFPAGEP
jgi:hypothetical protein